MQIVAESRRKRFVFFAQSVRIIIRTEKALINAILDFTFSKDGERRDVTTDWNVSEGVDTSEGFLLEMDA